MKIRSLFIFSFCALALVAVAAIGFATIRDMQARTRGVTFSAAGGGAAWLGVNVSLEQYSDGDLARALDLIRDAGITTVRQYFPWSEIEPHRGEYDWARWDRIVKRTRERELSLIAVLNTTPTWARHPGEADLVHAPPARVEDYAALVAAFVARYGAGPGAAPDALAVQLWDNPNVHPYWGRRNADPAEYTALLRAGALASRAVEPRVKIISAGLAPNTELIRGHPDFADFLFLRGMYEAGSRGYADIIAVKPYGMWTGPEDRRIAPDAFNFSRAVLLHEEMVARGDADKPVWAVEFGWNALPTGWEGKPSPWGTDSDEVQSARLGQAIQRAHSEWPWMTGLVVSSFQPNAPSDDPAWGFALVDADFRPRPLWRAIVDAQRAPVQPATFDFTRFSGTLAVLVLAAAVAVWQGWRAGSRIPWSDGWMPIKARFARLPEMIQFLLLAAAVIALCYSPLTAVNLALLGSIVLLFALRLDMGIALAVLAIPFYLLPKNLVGSMQFSLVEILTLACVVAWVIQWIVGERRLPASAGPAPWRRRAFESVDLAVVCFVLVGLLSVLVASNFGVANREFRVIVIEPALLYGLIRVANLSRQGLVRLVAAFVLSALAVSLIGLYQFFLTDYVIIGEGVRRVLAVYGSPNNLALYLARALPLLVALALFLENRRVRLVCALVALPIAAALYLTYSRGAWLLGLPAGLLFLAWFGERRTRFAVIGLLVLGVILLVPFLGTPRGQSLFQEGTGTGFFRVSVWGSGVAMLRDHPVLGVGLDNFLYEYDKYMNPQAWREPNLSHPHNVLLDFWLRTGLLGLGVMIWMVAGFYQRGLNLLRRPGSSRALALGLGASMTAALAHGMIDAAYFYVDLAFAFMLMQGVMLELREETPEI